ncbi:hypothetical protein EV278_105284 [Caulobacter sp. BK020]|nr:hypothetical protein EV278_105284 [Caulobacter sp. BK020]
MSPVATERETPMPRSRPRRLASARQLAGTEWTAERLGHLRRKILKRPVAFRQSLEFKRVLESEQQKAPGLSTGGSQHSTDEVGLKGTSG